MVDRVPSGAGVVARVEHVAGEGVETIRPVHGAFRLTLVLAGAGFCLTPLVGRAAPAEAGFDYEQIIERIEGEDLSEAEAGELIQIAELIKRRAKEELSFTERIERAIVKPWVVFGFLAQFAFMMRFVLQIVASERKKRSYVPVAFWHLSLIGGTMLFVYAAWRRDPVFMLGQGLGCFIYIRNLILIYRRRGVLNDRLAERRQRGAESGVDDAGAEAI